MWEDWMWKIFKHKETDQYIDKQLVGHWKNKGRGGSKKFLECNENENPTYQNLWDTAKAVLRRTFIAMNAYIKKIDLR
jgi:hypothetical protein